MMGKLLQYKKHICIAAVAVAVIAGAGLVVKEGLHYFLNVDGYVTAISGRQVTVSTKLYDRTVDFGGSYIDPAQALAVGDKVKIDKNFSGMVIGLKNETARAYPKAKVVKDVRFGEGGQALAEASFNKAGYRPSSIAAASVNRTKDELVVIEGTLASKISDDDYLVADGAGNNIIVDFDDDAGAGLKLQQRVKIYGKIEPKRTRVELEADYTEIIR